MDIKPIIVGYDGSERSWTALTWALDEGVRRGLPVRLAHVVDREWRLPGPAPPGCAGDPFREAEVSVKRIADEAYDWGRLGIDVTSAVFEGPVACTLCERSPEAGLLVMGDRGLGGFTGLRIGSVVLEVATHADCPVVVVRESTDVPSSRPVAVGVDDAPEARLAVGVAFEEAALRGVGIVAVRGSPAAPLATEERLLDEVVAPWRPLFPDVWVTTSLVSATATHALMVASRDAQLLVVGARGSGGFDGLRLGSVSHQLLHHALSAVMVVRGAGIPRHNAQYGTTTSVRQLSGSGTSAGLVR